MSDAIKVRCVRDEITPDLARLARQLSGPGRRAVLKLMGAEALSITQNAFHNASLRPISWPPLKHPTGRKPLIKTGQLMHGIHISELTENHVKIAPSVPYAVFHQLGTRHIPPRPFFPFTASGVLLPSAHQRIEGVARAAIERLLRR